MFVGPIPRMDECPRLAERLAPPPPKPSQPRKHRYAVADPITMSTEDRHVYTIRAWTDDDHDPRAWLSKYDVMRAQGQRRRWSSLLTTDELDGQPIVAVDVGLWAFLRAGYSRRGPRAFLFDALVVRKLIGPRMARTVERTPTKRARSASPPPRACCDGSKRLRTERSPPATVSTRLDALRNSLSRAHLETTRLKGERDNATEALVQLSVRAEERARIWDPVFAALRHAREESLAAGLDFPI